MSKEVDELSNNEVEIFDIEYEDVDNNNIVLTQNETDLLFEELSQNDEDFREDDILNELYKDICEYINSTGIINYDNKNFEDFLSILQK